ncbi:MAG: 16S rRNA (adenine(1518)-N(6)/adenine(1519)-N(6))-dimethyltransferase RsmA [Ruminococcaceae bacterium]|nr:16S rRNA (adenine(1518)-N(6)/adenine(1519)-N(6))-dimethyltransferase RsmA [Oscillospiraceae bacterium]
MKLTDISCLKSLMERHGISFNKNFGQNFLINSAIPTRIAEECGADPESAILEIGPGVGTMTVELCRLYKKVVAVEIDKNLLPVLNETLSPFDNVKVINADILDVDLNALIRDEFEGYDVSVCANLPYYITTPILMHLLESGIKLKNITVMVQKEVASRLCAAAGSSDYGAITAVLGYYGKIKRLFNVSAGSFMPAPKVDSSVVRLKMDDEPTVKVSDEKLFFRTVKGAFAQRRKTLQNSLSSEFSEIPKNDISDLIVSCGFKADIRGEKLSVEDLALLSNKLYEYKKK